MSNWRQADRGSNAWARQAPKRDARVILEWALWSDRVPPLNPESTDGHGWTA